MALCATSSPPSALDRMQNVIKEIGAEKQSIYTGRLENLLIFNPSLSITNSFTCLLTGILSRIQA